jgi:hypothetical protein
VTDREGHRLHPSPVLSEGRDEGGVLLGLFVELNVAAEVPAKADLNEDEGVLLFVEGVRVGRGSLWDPSCVDEVHCCAMPGFEQQLGLSMWEDPIRDAAWRCGAIFVSGGSGTGLNRPLLQPLHVQLLTRVSLKN